jgi:F0F1-type ATP synthase gamma subunit
MLLDELVASFRRLRQEEITGEFIELPAGSLSAALPNNIRRSGTRAM